MKKAWKAFLITVAWITMLIVPSTAIWYIRNAATEIQWTVFMGVACFVGVFFFAYINFCVDKEKGR